MLLHAHPTASDSSAMAASINPSPMLSMSAATPSGLSVPIWVENRRIRESGYITAPSFLGLVHFPLTFPLGSGFSAVCE